MAYLHSFSRTFTFTVVALTVLLVLGGYAVSPMGMRNLFTFLAGCGLVLAIPAVFLESPRFVGIGAGLLVCGIGVYLCVAS